MMVHRVCQGELIPKANGRIFCELCQSYVEKDEIDEVDNSPGPHSG
jgi:hypothetical protein